VNWPLFWAYAIDFWLYAEVFIGRMVIMLGLVWVLLTLADKAGEWIDKRIDVALAPKQSKY
jgi:hypothetical protein